MSGKTVTDKRIDAERKRVNAVCEQYYEEYPEPGIWSIDQPAAEKRLAQSLEPRPLSSMQVRKAFHAYTVAFKRACNVGSLDKTHGTDASGASDRVSVQGS